MSGETHEVRLLVAKRYDENLPFVIGGQQEGMQEIISQEDWDAWKRQQAAEALQGDEGNYEFAEVVIRLPLETLRSFFQNGPIVPTSIVHDESAFTPRARQ